MPASHAVPLQCAVDPSPSRTYVPTGQAVAGLAVTPVMPARFAGAIAPAGVKEPGELTPFAPVAATMLERVQLPEPTNFASMTIASVTPPLMDASRNAGPSHP